MTTAQSIDLDLLPIFVTYVGEVISPWDETQARTVDQWQVKITSPAGFWTTNYYTGTGLRRKNRYGEDRPRAPTKADILHSLTIDASAANENFTDWCANYGYSDDSIKALNTYKQCLEISAALRRHFKADTLAAIREAVAEM